MAATSMISARCSRTTVVTRTIGSQATTPVTTQPHTSHINERAFDMSIYRRKYTRLMSCERWRQLRASILREHPLCEECEKHGRFSTAEVVHHIIPLESISDPSRLEAMCYEPSNLMALCRKCHTEIHKAMGKNSRKEKKARESKSVDDMVERLLRDPGGTF